MAGLSDILGKEVAEGAGNAPSASLRSSCGSSQEQADPLDGLPCFGFAQKLEQARGEYPDAHIDGYVLFGSHTDALGLFDAAKKEGYPVRISPTPRAARASCGVALLVPVESMLQVCGLAQAAGIPIENAVALPRQINAKRDRYC